MEKKNDLQYEITFTVENISEVDDEGRYELLVCRDVQTVEFLWKVKINK